MSLTIEEICPECGGRMTTYSSEEPEFPESSKLICKTICSSCGYEVPELASCTFTSNGYSVAFGSIDSNPFKNIIIDADTIKLHQKGVDITIDISNEILSNIENIEINGFKFVKEK